MDNPFDSVKDSSIWYNPTSFQVAYGSDSNLYMGIVRSVVNDEDTGELRYIVEVRHRNDIILTNCRMLRNLGGVFNYEDVVLRGYNANSTSGQNSIRAKAGDVVLVGQFAGQGREGVILGGLTHPARSSFLDSSNGPQFRSEFNGVETYINQDGEYFLTFKGQPTNLDVLEKTPDKQLPIPKYDTKIGSSYLKFTKDGSFSVADNAEIPQYFKINKPDGKIEVVSGKVSLELIQKEGLTKLISKRLEIESERVKVQAKNVIVGDASTDINLSDGSKGAARIGDKCKFQLTAGPYTVIGTIVINEGSSKVKIG